MIWAEGRAKIEIFNEDCLPAMRKMKDNEFDLAIVDPPYFRGVAKFGFYGEKISNTGVKRGDYKTIEYWDENIPDEKYFDELFRVSKNQIIWGINYYSKYIDTPGRIIWDKKNDHSSFSKAEIAACSLINSVQMFRYMWNGMLQENMKNKEKRIHPTQKPIALYKWLLKNYAKEGDRILDTHLGSGSIAIACWDMKFDLVGFEIDKDYYEAAYKRFKAHIAQLKLDL